MYLKIINTLIMISLIINISSCSKQNQEINNNKDSITEDEIKIEELNNEELTDQQIDELINIIFENE